MDILILNWKDIKNPDVGGAEIILYELSKRLIKQGHTVTWFSRRFPGCSAEEYIDGIRFIHRGNKLTVYLEAYFYFKNLQKKPDKVLDCINTICWQTPLYVPQDKRVAYINQLAKEVLFYELPIPLSFLAYLLEPFQYRSYRSTEFLCYSESVKEDVAEFHIPHKNIRTFPLGIDHERYQAGVKSKDPLFLFVARLVNMKRPDLCIEAMKIVVRRYPKARLAIVGYGPQEETLQLMINQKNLQQNVSLVRKDALYLKRHYKDAKVRLMQQSWALLLPSVKEGWGMVVTEAAACGTPSVVSNVTGLRDSVVPNKTGIVLSTYPSSKELAAAMITLIQDVALRKQLSRGALFWSKRFDWKTSYTVFVRQLQATI